MPPRSVKQIIIHQTFINDRHPPITLTIVPESSLDYTHFEWLLPTSSEPHPRVIGMHCAYTNSGLVAALAVSFSSKVLLITDIKKNAGQTRPRHGISTDRLQGRTYLQTLVLSNPSNPVVSFNGHELVLGLHRDMGLRCVHVVDLLSLPPENRDIAQTVKSALGPRIELFDDAILRGSFQDCVYDKDQQIMLAQKAWLAQVIGSHPGISTAVARIPIIDSTSFDESELDLLSKGIQGLVVHDLDRPNSRTIKALANTSFGDNKFTFIQSNYGERIRMSSGQFFKASVQDQVTLTGTLSSVEGKKAKLKFAGLDGISSPEIKSIVVLGKADLSFADKQNHTTILHALQRRITLFNDVWMDRLFPHIASTETQSHSSDIFQSQSSTSPIKNEWARPGDDSWFASASISDSGQSIASGQDEGWPQSSSDPWSTPNDEPSKIQPDVNDLTEVSSVPWSSSQEGSIGIQSDIQTGALGDGPWAVKSPEFPSKLPQSSTCHPLPTHHTQQVVFSGTLNASQTWAVQDMLDTDKHISVIKGPPGTGKTTVIAAYIASILAQPGETVWIIAQSNVAVKNIAEKLLDAHIKDWVLLVSAEFIKGWHEHLYHKIPKCNMLSSVHFRSPPSCRVIICTISMLSNKKVSAFSKTIPVQSLVVDEASQVSMTNYMPIIAKFGKKLKKLCFIGDDKQLPPYASETSSALDSVFQNKLLLNSIQVILLNVQYRMPPPIGQFLSNHVYLNELQSWSDHPVQVPLCCQFLDVMDGREEPDDSKSFRNPHEISAAIQLAKILAERQKSFKLITPYESQRDLLEHMLKESGLPWGNTCFTVDSFQGNEEDYIIISIVRTRSVGFLQDHRRSNVMLSRARRGMFICSKYSFLDSQDAKHTLLGKMAEAWAGVDGGWIVWDHQDHQSLENQIHID